MKSLVLFFLGILAFSPSTAQHSVKIGTQIPVQYGMQYDYKFHTRWSVNVQVGVLTKPYDQAILSLLESLGVNQDIVNVLTSAFSVSLTAQAGTIYHFKKNYVGVTGSWIHLQTADTPVSAVEAPLGVSASSYPPRPRQSASPIQLALSSDLYNAGILYGRRFTFSNPKIELYTELSNLKTIASYSYLESPQRSLESLSTLIDAELKTICLGYGYLPSIYILFVYKLCRN